LEDTISEVAELDGQLGAELDGQLAGDSNGNNKTGGLDGQPGNDSIGEFDDDDDDLEELAWSSTMMTTMEDLFELELNMAGYDRMEVDSTPEADGLRRMKPIVVDSGAAESVMDPEDAPGYEVTESAGSRRGAKYVGPGGGEDPEPRTAESPAHAARWPEVQPHLSTRPKFGSLCWPCRAYPIKGTPRFSPLMGRGSFL
jgi:hypothetical protein